MKQTGKSYIVKITSFLLLVIFVLSFNNANSQVICDGKQVVILGDITCNSNPYTLVFEDNFDGNNLDPMKWDAHTGVTRDALHASQQEWLTPNNIEVSNGTLKLISKKEQLLNQCFSIWYNAILGMQTFCQDFNYTSAEIESKFKFHYGKYEIRCKLPKGVGFWPAFWMFGGPGWHEIDVFEFWNEKDLLGKIDPAKLSKVHNMNAHHDYDGDGKSENCSSKYSGPDFSASFHTFTLIYTKHKLEWYVDGVLKRVSTLFYSMLGQPLDCQSLQSEIPLILDKAFPQKPMKIIANLAIQAGDNAPNSDTPFPSALEIDYIRYYQQTYCAGEVNINTLANLSSELYNVVVGSTVNINGNLTLQQGQQLQVIASNQINISPSFVAQNGSFFGTEIAGVCASNKTGSIDDNYNIVYKEIADESAVDSFGINVYPNPNTGIFVVETQGKEIGFYDFYLSDTQGRFLSKPKVVHDKKIIFDITALCEGLYFLNVFDKKTSTTQTYKVVKIE